MSLDDLIATRDTLDLGCGRRKHPQAIGVDIDPNVKPDLLHDLDRGVLPLPSNHFRIIICQDIIEHINDIEQFLLEVHRVAADGASIAIRTPHFSSWYAYNNPTHRHVLGYFALDRYTELNPQPGRTALFRYRKREIIFPRLYRLTGIAKLANAKPARYEQMFAFIFPAENINIELEALKQ